MCTCTCMCTCMLMHMHMSHTCMLHAHAHARSRARRPIHVGLLKSACPKSLARRAAPLAAVCKPGTPLDRSIYGDYTSHSGLHLPWTRRRPPSAPFYSTLFTSVRPRRTTRNSRARLEKRDPELSFAFCFSLPSSPGFFSQRCRVSELLYYFKKVTTRLLTVGDPRPAG